MADTRTEFQKLLNDIVSTDNKIDAVFVFDSKRGKIMFSNKSTSYNGFNAEVILTFESWLGRFKDTTRSIDRINLGNAKYLVIPFDNGLICLFFEEIVGHPIIIGFAYKGTDGEAAMGEMLFHTDIENKKIKNFINELLPKT
jgi:hypothetical protein